MSGPAEPKPWQPGDRVIVRLPDSAAPRGPHGLGGRAPEVDVHGRVLAADGHGVSIVLDREVNGEVSCYATHGELRPETP
jgi:hypothetical protein